MSPEQRFTSFADFYPYYLSEHAHPVSRRLHFVGTTIAALLLTLAISAQMPFLVPLALVQGYAFAWVGHFFFEKNKPATFRYPRYSLMGDWRMWFDMIKGKIKF